MLRIMLFSYQNEEHYAMKKDFTKRNIGKFSEKFFRTSCFCSFGSFIILQFVHTQSYCHNQLTYLFHRSLYSKLHKRQPMSELEIRQRS